ncbi:MAG: glycogen synthase GlgA [Nitrospinae bacterium]|nr:glycogen synthase GlgA [Nitrospinota bacterium]
MKKTKPAPKKRGPVKSAKRLKVAFAASEAVPFIKTGGLADVAGALPKGLSAQGCDVVTVIPLYGAINREGLVKTDLEFYVNVGNRAYLTEVYKGKFDDATPVYLIHNRELFARPNPYGDENGDYPDNDRRFIFFNLAVLELLRLLKFRPDIMHVNDWHLGLVPVLLKNLSKGDFLRGVRSVLSIHSLAYQGLFPKESFELTGLPPELYSTDGVEMHGQLALLKSAILFSDGIAAVSPTYAKEILSPTLGFGLEKVLKKRKEVLTGFLNGVDMEEWNPEVDPLLPFNYSAKDLSGKAMCRAKLLKVAGLKNIKERPVVGIVSRLVGQKGFDMVVECADELMQLDLTLVVVGTGQKKFEDFFSELKIRRPDRVFCHIGYDDRLAHLIEAGSDVFLMPSVFEPCGLNQMYSMIYGTPPVVRATGGLKDSVQNWSPAKKTGTGFVFQDAQSPALLAAVKRAIKTFGKKKEWARLVINCMARDFSWRKSAADYKGFYKKIIAS